MSTPRTMLLVGEGNFSFSAALCQLYPDSSITATCLQCQEEVLRHEGAATNTEIIRSSGGVVLFEVDSTKLGECASLRGLVFDRVIFNFPHCGRKSGVKKNRELLKNFFLSCVQVLAEKGEVHVALCNGQGGTPADQPKREWHNSWQVVAMAAEANLILSNVHPFESEKYKSYKCTGYRSQDKGFHVENALLHVFTRSLPYSTVKRLQLEEAIDGERVQYNMPVEFSDYIFREFLSTGSTHPVRLVQDFLLSGLAEQWSVSMKTETHPYLLTCKQLQKFCQEIDPKDCYWINLLCKDSPHISVELHTDMSKHTDQSIILDSEKHQGVKLFRSAYNFEDDTERGRGLFVLRPSLLPQMKELKTHRPEDKQREPLASITGDNGENEKDSDEFKVEGKGNEDPYWGSNGIIGSLCGISGLVFRNVPISPWNMPAFHELCLTAVFPAACEPIKMLGKHLETLLAPYRVSLIMEHGCLGLVTQPMGLVGKVFASNASDNISKIGVNVSLNLDLLATLLFSLPDWRLLWSHDPHFLKHFSLHPSLGQPFQLFSLFPQHFSFDISFWTGPAWGERRFHALVREASLNTVAQVKLIDTFSHPDLNKTSYCYRLIYHSETHALSHTQALKFHKHLESMLSSRLEVTVR
ncbi:ferredoxin-fold anticodon-binding domain-containing protein 1 [Lampris incognitus]|uniref:ferredoxin-fold anticodon-binding domain-containing protein 1 n=1 Tax=Lampris incognitus TaxID=2546036 RepID=UPI0024B51CD5|nr:ferredoxin-fold anticodon-binding domain-containing protein 1 [Lampris incognitus]